MEKFIQFSFYFHHIFFLTAAAAVFLFPSFHSKLSLDDVDVGASYSVIYDNFENEKTEQKNSSLYFMLSIKFY